MSDLLAAIIIYIVVVAVMSPEFVGSWLKRVDDVRYIETMYE